MKKKVFSILFVILLGSSLNIYFNKTGTLNIEAAQNVAALAAGGDDFEANNTGPGKIETCTKSNGVSGTIKYCMSENPYPCTQSLDCK
jgi:hypothetical protein